MGRLRHKRTHHARRDVSRGARTRVRTKDLDQIERDLEHNVKKLRHQPIDEDKPGLGQHYCLECAKYYESQLALTTHTKSKVHKRRLKELRAGAYTVGEAERAAGLSGTDNRQRGVDDVIRRFGDASVVPVAAAAQAPAAAAPGKMPQNNAVHAAPAASA